MTAAVPPCSPVWRAAGAYRARPAPGAVAIADGSHRGRRPASSDGSPARLAGQTWKRREGRNRFREKATRSGIPGPTVAVGCVPVVGNGSDAAAVFVSACVAKEDLVGVRQMDAGSNAGEVRT